MRGNGWFTCDGCNTREQDLGGAMPLPEGWLQAEELCAERFCEGHPVLYCSKECQEENAGNHWVPVFINKALPAPQEEE